MSYWDQEEYEEAEKPLESEETTDDSYEEETLEGESEITEEDVFKTLNDATLRLEQGSLYKMLLTNDIFSGVDADPRAIAAVKKELIAFAKNRLDILVGIKKPSNASEGFSSEEMFLLKKMLGRVMSNEKNTQESRPLLHKTSSLKPIQVTNKKTLEKKPAIQIKKTESNKKSGPNDSRLKKPISEMTPEELKAHSELIAKEQAGKKVKPVKGAIPMPDTGQIQKMYTLRAQTSNDGGLVHSVMRQMNKTLNLAEDVGDGSGGDFDPNERF